MIVTMQGNWTVRVKSRNAGFPQRFVISGAATGNGTYNGVTTTPAVSVTGSQWTIAIQHNPGNGFQLSDSKIKFPQQVGVNYQFDIQSNDSGADEDFDDLILTCSTPSSPNKFLLYGNVTLYSGYCVFNPCRKDIFVIETPNAFQNALKNAHLRALLEKLYPERIPPFKIDPNPPDPPYFKPVVIDLYGEAMQPKTLFNVSRVEETATASKARAKDSSAAEDAAGNFKVEELTSSRSLASESLFSRNSYEIAKAIDSYFRFCPLTPGNGLTLTFEEYDRTNAEKAGGSYTGTGNRRMLGDTITDMFGNYIFRYSFDMSFPGLEDADDFVAGENVNVFPYPDVIVKVTGSASWDVLHETAPYYNVRNLRRIDLCLPKSKIPTNSSCANGNLIGGLGNVFIGGNQNTSASTLPAALRRYGSNYLEANGVISVRSSLAGFKVECAAWHGMVDIFGCIYDETKSLSDNKIRWYTIRIRRQGTSGWAYVTENYKHPKFLKRNLPGYNGDDVGPFPTTIEGVPDVPAYKNIRAELHSGATDTDWEDTHIGRLMQLHTTLYDKVSGETTPGTFYLRIDGYDAAGNHVSGKRDLIALYIHNKGLNFELTGPKFVDNSILYAGCGLYRLTDAQNNKEIKLSFMANDPDGFVNAYEFSTDRCPGGTIALQASPMDDTAAGITVLAGGASTSTHEGDSPDIETDNCDKYTGTLDEFGAGMIDVILQPGTGETGWIKPGEYFTIYSFSLIATQRVTNGYNGGVSGEYKNSGQIMMEKLTP